MKWEHRVVVAVIALGLLPMTQAQTPSLDQQVRSTTQQIVSTAGGALPHLTKRSISTGWLRS